MLSGRAAAYLWGLLKGPAPPAEVTAPTARRLKGANTSHARRAKREATTWRGVPITTVGRTLVDLAAAVDETELARACHQAGVRHHTTPKQVERVLARHPNTKGAGTLRAVMRGEPRHTAHALRAKRRATASANAWAIAVLPLAASLRAWELVHAEGAARSPGPRRRFRRYTYNDVYENGPELRCCSELRARAGPRRPRPPAPMPPLRRGRRHPPGRAGRPRLRARRRSGR